MTKCRIKVVDRNRNTMFLVVNDGVSRLYADTGMEHALSNIAGKNAMLLRFALEDATARDQVLQAVRKLVPSVTAELC